MSLDLSLDNKAREKAFQDHIIEQLVASGWLVPMCRRASQRGGRNTARPTVRSQSVICSTPWLDPLRAMSGAPCGYSVIR